MSDTPTPDTQPAHLPNDGDHDRDEQAAEKANAEVERIVDEAEDKGYFGTTSDPNPNLAYSPQTGPDAPPLAPDDRTRTVQPQARKES